MLCEICEKRDALVELNSHACARTECQLDAARRTIATLRAELAQAKTLLEEQQVYIHTKSSPIEAFEALAKQLAQVRAELAGAQSQAAAACRAMRNLLSTIIDESDGYRIADGFHEAVEAAVKIAPPEFMTALECDHCGDVAHESITGMFGDGDGVACMSCGWPGNVSADEESVYWSMDDDGKCTRSDCDECAATSNETKEVES